MNDLQNGGLRKRRGGNLDFGDWDSDDDDDEDAEERRRRWELRREEIKRRILDDENLGKLGTFALSHQVTYSASCESQDSSVCQRDILLYPQSRRRTRLSW
jgi:MRC1-like domain